MIISGKYYILDGTNTFSRKVNPEMWLPKFSRSQTCSQVNCS